MDKSSLCNVFSLKDIDSPILVFIFSLMSFIVALPPLFLIILIILYLLSFFNSSKFALLAASELLCKLPVLSDRAFIKVLPFWTPILVGLWCPIGLLFFSDRYLP